MEEPLLTLTKRLNTYFIFIHRYFVYEVSKKKSFEQQLDETGSNMSPHAEASSIQPCFC